MTARRLIRILICGDRLQSIRPLKIAAHHGRRMNASTHPDTPPTTAPLALWRVAEAFMHILHALFGSPTEIAERHTFLHKEHRLIASWVRAGEAMMRRLLIIEAAAYAKPNERPLLCAPRKSVRRKKLCYSDKPEGWRVSFRCNAERMPRAPRLKSQPTPQRNRTTRADRYNPENWKPVTFHDAWPLALRVEALLRVFNNPLPYARRLARRLYAKPHLIDALLRAPQGIDYQVDRFSEFADEVTARRPVFYSSA